MGRKPRVLVVDRQASSREHNRVCLTEAGYEVQQSDAPLGTTKAALRIKPDVLILDVGISPVGVERVVGVLRKSEELRGMPILLLGDPGQRAELAAEASRLRADGFLLRGRDAQGLIAAVARAVAGRGDAAPTLRRPRRHRPGVEEHDLPVFFDDAPPER
jgi:DNA-binding NarL/FixJ family response regulator